MESIGAALGNIFTGGLASLAIFIANLVLYRRGRTLGATIFRLRVVRENGELAGFYQMFVRQSASVLSLVPLGLGFWWAFGDAKRQTWHDKLLKTYVMLDSPALQGLPGTSSHSAKVWFWIIVAAIVIATFVYAYTLPSLEV